MTRSSVRHDPPETTNSTDVSPSKKARRSAKPSDSSVLDTTSGPSQSGTVPKGPEPDVLPSRSEHDSSAVPTPNSPSDPAAEALSVVNPGVGAPVLEPTVRVAAVPAVPPLIAPNGTPPPGAPTVSDDAAATTPVAVDTSAPVLLSAPSTPTKRVDNTQSSPINNSTGIGSASSSTTSTPARVNVSTNKVAIRRPASLLPIRPIEPMTLDTRSYLDAQDVERFNGLRKLSEPDSATYAVGMLPEVLSWGAPARGHDDRRTYITQGQTRVKVCIIGELLKLEEIGGGVYGSRAVLTVLPLIESDAARLDDLLGTFATSTAMPTTDIWERGAWMSQLIPKKAVTMDAIYDARVDFGLKTAMPRLGATALSRNDIILAEAYITRYQHADDVTKVQRYRDNWVSIAYRVSLELVSISLLKTVDAPL
ncbi:hypothetical protein QCA50_015090 [Cerrena zonata]|uniref:Uncharacterized protein n=1 Tax=Cerrena zonata TaxID=2478898 RepID=A0AAW0FJ57_9APHY